MGVREDFAGLGQMPGSGKSQPKQPEYIIVGYGPGGEPMVRPGPGVSDLTSWIAVSEFGTKPIPLSQFQQFLNTSKTHAFNKAASPVLNSPAGIAVGMMLGRRGSNPAGFTQNPRVAGGGVPAGSAPNAARAAVAPPVLDPLVSAPGAVKSSVYQIPRPPAGPAAAPSAGVSAPGAVSPQWGQGGGASGGVSAPGAVPPSWVGPPSPPSGVKAPGAMPGPGAPPIPGQSGAAPRSPGASWNGMEPGGMSGQQMSQMDAAGAGIANAFTAAPLVPGWAKAAGGAAAALGAAALAGRSSGKDSLAAGQPRAGQPPQASQWPFGAGAPGFDQWQSMYPEQPGQGQPAPAPTAPTTGPQRGPSRPMGRHRIAGGGAAQGVAGSAGGAGQQAGGGYGMGGGGGNPRAPAANYYSDMLGAADSGDAYARDLVNLTAQARQVAYKANQEGKHLQFVPLHDMRNNRLFLVNANGQDVVLDLNDEGDKAAFGRMTAKIGVDPASIMAWAQGSSRPLHRYMVPPGSQGDWAPQFGEPGSQAPQVGAQPAAAAQEPQASPAPFVLPQVPHMQSGGGLPTMGPLSVNADRPTDARFAEIEALRGQGLGGSQLDEQERKLRELRATNPTAYARGLGG